MKNKTQIIFLLFSLILVNWLIEYNKEIKTQHYLKNTTQEYLQKYEVLYNEHKKLTQSIFTTVINTKQVKNILLKTIGNDKQRHICRFKTV
jgi:hypothetical protein